MASRTPAPPCTLHLHFLCGGNRLAVERVNGGQREPVASLALGERCELPTFPGTRYRLSAAQWRYMVVTDALPLQEHCVVMPPPTAGPPPAGSEAYPRAKATLRGLAAKPELNGCDAIVMYFVPGKGRWAVHLLHAREPLLVRPEHLCVKPAPHRETREGRLKAEARQLVGAASAAGSGNTVGFGVGPPIGDEPPVERELPADLVVLALFPLLERCTRTERGPRTTIRAGSLDTAAAVSHEWRSAALALRALAPACARDVGLKLRLDGGADGVGGDGDGEYPIYRNGERGRPPMLLHCHNVLSSFPTEYVDLPERGNYSYFPRGGTATVDLPADHPHAGHVATRFAKLRVCPWTLLAKTDDVTFATTDGGPLSFAYWNGARHARFECVPFATARDVRGRTGFARLLERPSEVRGAAGLNLRGTGFGVDIRAFASMGCAAGGLVLLPLARHTERCKERRAAPEDALADAWQDEVVLAGGGFAGRCAPRRDTTVDELAAGHDCDHEGRNGGWVLELLDEGQRNAILVPVGGPVERNVHAPRRAADGELAGASEELCRYMPRQDRTGRFYVRAPEELQAE